MLGYDGDIVIDKPREAYKRNKLGRCIKNQLDTPRAVECDASYPATSRYINSLTAASPRAPEQFFHQ